jgi:hypothetical protein
MADHSIENDLRRNSMKENTLLGFVAMISLCGGVARAEPAAPAPSQMNLSDLPKEIAGLNWKTVDIAALTPQQRCQALLLLNDKLASIAAMATSQANLLSMYIDQQNLGADFAKQAPMNAMHQLTFTDAMKVAVALIQGPMSTSSYASAFSDSSPDTLAAYAQMYDATCQRRWMETAEARHQVRSMAAFLKGKGKLQEYETWAGAEAARRQQQYAQTMAQRRMTEEAVQNQRQKDQQVAAAQEQRIEQENLQLQQALALAQQQQRAQAPPMQQNAAQAQQQAANTQQPNYPLTQPEAPGLIPGAEIPEPAYYGGAYYGYGAPAYYGTNSAWAYDVKSEAAARAETENRISGWHGVGGGTHRR